MSAYLLVLWCLMVSVAGMPVRYRKPWAGFLVLALLVIHIRSVGEAR